MKRKLTGIFLILTGLAALGVTCAAGINIFMVASVKNMIGEPPENFGADCVIVLGAGVLPDGRPSAMLEDRLLAGIALYKDGAAPKLLVSGDHGRKNYDEVNSMKAYAMDREVPSEDVFMDHAGFSTYESLYRAKTVFGARRVIIVTQRYHLYRALYIARSLGLDAVGVSADARPYAGQTYRDARELLARVKDTAYCLFKPRPTYLGASIPINGNGDLTND